MSGPSFFFRPHDEAPARAQMISAPTRPPWSGLDCAGFEFVSRGDFVPGELAQPSSEGPHPLLLLVHGTGDGATSRALDFAADWVRSGWAVARIDLPLHGRRASPKLSARLVDGLEALDAVRPIDLDTRALLEEFARQSTSDLVRCLEALTTLPAIEPTRVALMGLGIGACACAWALVHDGRPCAAVLLRPTSPPEGDPLDPIDALASRPPDAAPLLVTLHAGSSKSARRLADLAHAERSIEASGEAPTAAEVAAAGAFLERHCR